MYVSSKSETHPQLNFKEYVGFVFMAAKQKCTFFFKNVLFKIKR